VEENGEWELNLGFGSNGFWRENEEDLSVKTEEAIIID
jgi:hypothetical protein